MTRAFRNYKALGDAALAQAPDAHLATAPDPNSNSIAVTVRHLAGNFRSRYRDFLTTDGEKPDRDRDGEFEERNAVTRAELLGSWEDGWSVALGSIDRLAADDVERTVHIRGEAFQVFEALNRSLAHTAYHVGQIVYLARHFAGPEWKSLSIPKGESSKFASGAFKARGLTGR